ncbi:prophage DNA primase [Arthrobacter sp. MWB30]|nr:prophage DNA primase [Arthrobacter sp. MWB30]
MALPQNEIIRSATQNYLLDLDLKNPPAASVIEKELIDKVNAEIAIENTVRDKDNRIIPLRTLTNTQIAEIMLKLNRVVRIAPAGKNTDRDYDLLAIYAAAGDDEGIYVTSEDNFRSVARQYNYGLTTNDFKEVHAALKDGAPRTHPCDDRDLVAVRNGIFDYRSKTLRSFNPKLVFLSKSQVNYNPQAINVPITHPGDKSVWDVESWMQELSDDPEIVELLWQILGAIVRPHVRWNKSAWFYSEAGNNGKGTLCQLMRNLTGPTSHASIPINDFGKDFMLEPLTRASAIIVDENDVGTFVDKAANLKAIITNDVISINRKHKTPISYQFWGFMVQCLNEFPRIKDKSDSFYRRQLFVPFTKNFEGVERKYIKDDYLHRQDVLEYVLKRVLHMDFYDLAEPEATKLVLAEYKEFNDPVRAFFREFEEQFVWDLLPFQFLYDLYRAWFAQTSPSGSPVGRNIFNKDLLAIVRKSEIWYCADKEAKIRPARKLSKPEPLIVEYELKDWVNKSYSGTTVSQRALPFPLKANYRGLLRRVPNSGPGVACDDPTDGPDDENGPLMDLSETPFTDTEEPFDASDTAGERQLATSSA